MRDILDEDTAAWGVNLEVFELRRFESEGRNLWRELAVPRRLPAAETTVRQLERDIRDASGPSGAWSAPALP